MNTPLPNKLLAELMLSLLKQESQQPKSLWRKRKGLIMPYVNKPRPYGKEYQQEKSRGEHERRMERQRARRSLDKKLPDGNGYGKADAREGKDVAHVKALDKGGSNKDGLRIQSAAKNRSFKRDSKGNLVSETSKKERKK
jgi:hypothetical protein